MIISEEYRVIDKETSISKTGVWDSEGKQQWTTNSSCCHEGTTRGEWSISCRAVWGHKFVCNSHEMNHNYAQGHGPSKKNPWRKNIKPVQQSPKQKLGTFQDHPSILRGDILEKLSNGPLWSNCYSYTWLEGLTLNSIGITLETSRYNPLGSLIHTIG